MPSGAKSATSARTIPAALRWSRVGAVLLLPFIALTARAEPPASSAISAATRLDLHLLAQATPCRVPELRARVFPATFTQLTDLSSRDYLRDLSLPTMGGDGRGVRDQSPTEQMVRQVRKEGLPLARLWQNDQALVSLGLNRRGKPGLWIIQKTR